MARGAFALMSLARGTLWHRAGGVYVAALGLALFVCVFIGAPIIAVSLRAQGVSLAPGDMAALRFTVVQAVLSASLSVLLAIPVARALARRHFWGRGALITLLGAPFLLPTLVAVLGLTAVFGRAGPINTFLHVVGLERFSIYGLQGVVIAHVFLNLPLAARMILMGWHSIPQERFRLAEALDMSAMARFWHIERPMLRAVLPGAFMVIFALCLTSFAVALTLGGGPRATTLELAIWQAVRFDFDLGRAGLLAVIQLGLCLCAALLAAWVMRPATFGAGRAEARGATIYGEESRWRLWGDVTALALVLAFLLPPLIGVVLRGAPHISALPETVWASALRSLIIALCCGALTTTAALILAFGVLGTGRMRVLLELSTALPLAVSGLVMGTGLFILILPFMPPARAALLITLLVNIVLSLPFVYRLVLPAAQAVRDDYGRLAESLDMRGAARLRWLIVPRLARPLGLGAGLSAALSMGDLGVIALFNLPDRATLPLMIQRLMGAYRMDEAMAAALLLVTLSFALFSVFDLWGRYYARA